MRRALGILAGCLMIGCGIGLLQVLVESAVLAVAYDGALLPAYDFFETRAYDAYVKIYVAVADRLGGGFAPGEFFGPTVTDKLALPATLVAINLLVGVSVGLVLAVLARPLRLLGRDGRLRGRAAVAVVLAAAAMVHVLDWATGVHVPKDPSIADVVKNAARNLLHDGTLLAGTAWTLTALASALLLRTLGSRLAGMTVAAATAVAALAVIVGGAAGNAANPMPARAPVLEPAAAVAAGYNVVLISIDSLRADHVGAYGYPRATSPTIDALADDGVVFRNASSTTSWTLPSHLSMLTGRSTLGHGVGNDDHRLPDDVPTLAEAFQRAGYRTGAVVSAPYLESRYGFARGFDDYDDQTIRWETHGDSYSRVTAPLVQATAADWLARNRQHRFFLFLHYWDVHYDYAPGAPYETMFDPDYGGSITGDNFYFNPAVHADMDPRDLEHIIALYDGEIRLVDDHLGRLRTTLEELGIAGRTIIVVTADHGDEFFEHGHKGHRRGLYDEVLRVPLVMHVPGVVPTRSVVETEASLIDLAPTLLTMTGVAQPAEVEGIDLSAIAFGDAPERDRATIGELYRTESLMVHVSIRRTGRKVIQGFPLWPLEAFDLTRDPGEQSPAPPADPHLANLATELVGWLNERWPEFQRHSGYAAEHRIVLDEETEERLRALGYLQ